MASNLIPLAEIFGPTIQGEGKLAGVPTYFLRVGGCDYACEWCDSAHAVVAEQVKGLPRRTSGELAWDMILYAKAHPGPDWLTISGGNPALYDLRELVRVWHARGTDWIDIPGGLEFSSKINVETQGSKWQDWLANVDLLTVSPKPPSSGMVSSAHGHAFSRFMDHVILSPTDERSMTVKQAILKVVVFDKKDYDFARGIHENYPFIPFYLSCGTASGGLTSKWVPSNFRRKDVREQTELNWTPESYLDSTQDVLDRYRWLAETAMADPTMSDVTVLPQIHALTWGITTRGV